jgi:hypothetical protein
MWIQKPAHVNISTNNPVKRIYSNTGTSDPTYAPTELQYAIKLPKYTLLGNKSLYP